MSITPKSTSLGNSIFSQFACQWLGKKKSFDVAKEHFRLSECEQKGSHQSDSSSFMSLRTEKKDPEESTLQALAQSPNRSLYFG